MLVGMNAQASASSAATSRSATVPAQSGAANPPGTPDVLFVAATRTEAAGLPREARVLITGVGCVPAAATVAAELAKHRPVLVVNLGTAGALVPHLNGIFTVDCAIKHDLAAEEIEAITGVALSNTAAMLPAPGFTVATLATGDCFIDDEAQRDALAQRAQLCDMEGYAVAWACGQAGVPCVGIKQVSDQADAAAGELWAKAAKAGRNQLAEAAVRAAQAVLDA